MKLCCVAIGVAALFLPANAQKAAGELDAASNIDYGGALVEISPSPTDSPTAHPLKGTPLPKKCKDEINDGRQFSKFCTTWLQVNDDFTMPTHSPSAFPSAAPTPFYKVQSSTFIGNNERLSLSVDIFSVDDTFIETFRPGTPLGDKTNLKIDSKGGTPTKVSMLKFNIGETMGQIMMNDNLRVSLKSAKLDLYAKSTGALNQFGGYIEEIDPSWSGETAEWRDYVKGGQKEKKDAQKLLPGVNDTLASFEGVSPLEWAEADVTDRLQEIAGNWSNDPISQFALRITTDKSEGVVYSSKEDVNYWPKLSLVFEYEGTPLEVAAAVAAASNGVGSIRTSKPTSMATSNPTSPPTTVPSPLPTPLPTPIPVVSTAAPVVKTESPVAMTTSPTVQTESPIASTSSPTVQTESPVVVTQTPTTLSPVASTAIPTLTPSRAPSSPPTHPPTQSPTIVEVVTEEPTEAIAFADITATSVVTQMFRLNIEATAETVRRRGLKGTRKLGPFMSLDEKERPALEEHLMNVYNESLTSSPVRVDITFVNDNMDVEIVSSDTVVRSNEFKISAIFLDPRIASIAANEASAVLDRATLHAFTGAENAAFVSILKNTGDPIISTSEQVTVDVTKISFSIGNALGQSVQAAMTTSETNVNTSKEGSNAAEWAGPALAIGASLVIVASALASFILIRQRRQHYYSYDDEEETYTKKPSSPTNTEAVTPSPPPATGRFHENISRTNTTVQDQVAVPSKNLNYDFSPASPRKFVVKQEKDFDCPPHIKVSHLQNTSFDDSTVSNVSAYIYGGIVRSPERYVSALDGDKSGIESEEQFLFDNVLGNDHELPADGSTPNFLVDDDSAVGNVPSELYSHMSIDDSTTTHSHDLPSVHGVKAYMLDGLSKAKDAFMDMPPPPSDAASESSQEDFPSDPFSFYDNSEGVEQCENAINDELNKVMMILNEPATEDEKTEPISNMYDVPYLESKDRKGAAENADGSVQSSVLSEDDPVKLMNSALDDCMAILHKARPNADIV